MKQLRRFAVSTALGAVLGILLGGCGAPPGQPRADAIPAAPNDLLEFGALYAANCAGCHGTNGSGSAAIALADPMYLAIVDEGAMRARIASGVRGTSMPAFAQSAGGMLTEKQIDALVAGVRSWRRAGVVDGANPPSYAATAAGDARRGEAAYKTFCQSCHGPEGQGGPKGSAITNDSFLALTSDQGLRTIVIAGRPDLGSPDWRGYVDGRPVARGFSRAMSDQEVTDVVSWLASHRVAAPAQPYVTAQNDQR